MVAANGHYRWTPLSVGCGDLALTGSRSNTVRLVDHPNGQSNCRQITFTQTDDASRRPDAFIGTSRRCSRSAGSKALRSATFHLQSGLLICDSLDFVAEITVAASAAWIGQLAGHQCQQRVFLAVEANPWPDALQDMSRSSRMISMDARWSRQSAPPLTKNSTSSSTPHFTCQRRLSRSWLRKSSKALLG